MDPFVALAVIDHACRLGAYVEFGPVDTLNPACGYEAKVTMATPWKAGPTIYRGSSDVSASAALLDALAKVPR